jgi:hypothetical protein
MTRRISFTCLRDRERELADNKPGAVRYLDGIPFSVHRKELGMESNHGCGFLQLSTFQVRALS